MLFRLGLLLGFAIGYVLGAKAGVERYAQLQSLGRQLTRSEPAQQISGEVRDAASRVSNKIESRASEKVSQISQSLRGGSTASDFEPLSQE